MSEAEQLPESLDVGGVTWSRKVDPVDELVEYGLKIKLFTHGFPSAEEQFCEVLWFMIQQACWDEPQPRTASRSWIVWIWLGDAVLFERYVDSLAEACALAAELWTDPRKWSQPPG